MRIKGTAMLSGSTPRCSGEKARISQRELKKVGMVPGADLLLNFEEVIGNIDSIYFENGKLMFIATINKEYEEKVKFMNELKLVTAPKFSANEEIKKQYISYSSIEMLGVTILSRSILKEYSGETFIIIED